MSNMSFPRQDLVNRASGLMRRGPHSCFQPPQRCAVDTTVPIGANDVAGTVNPATPDLPLTEHTTSESPLMPRLVGLGRRRMERARDDGGAAPMLPDSFGNSSASTGGAVLFPRVGNESPLLFSAEMESFPYLPMDLSSSSSTSESISPAIPPKGASLPRALMAGSVGR